MKIPWPKEFEDGDVMSFLKEFEAVAELVGVKEPKAKTVVLGTLLRGRAKAVYDSLDGAGGIDDMGGSHGEVDRGVR